MFEVENPSRVTARSSKVGPVTVKFGTQSASRCDYLTGSATLRQIDKPMRPCCRSLSTFTSFTSVELLQLHFNHLADS